MKKIIQILIVALIVLLISVQFFAYASDEFQKKIILSSSTFLGSDGLEFFEGAQDVLVADDNTIYVLANVEEMELQLDALFFDLEYNGGDSDILVAHFDQNLQNLLGATFLGSSGGDFGYGMTINARKEIVVTGKAGSDDFPVTSKAYDKTFGGDIDSFVSVFSGDLSELKYSTFIGGAHGEEGRAVEVNSKGEIIVAGWAYGGDSYPTTEGAYQNSIQGYADATLAVFDHQLKKLKYSSYLGGPSYDQGTDLALSQDGSIYILTHSSLGFPVTENAYDTTYNYGAWDAGIAKFSPKLDELIAATYLGSDATEYAAAIKISQEGSVYVSGSTKGDFPTTGDAIGNCDNGAEEIFVSALSSNLENLDYSTCLGGPRNDVAQTMDLDKDNYVYISGYTNSKKNFPTYQDAYNGGKADAFLMVISPHLDSLLASTLYGGPQYDFGNRLTVSDGQIYVVGSASEGFPVTTNAYDTEHNGSLDNTITQFQLY